MSSAATPRLRSWIDIPPDHDFSIHNLPYGIFDDGRGARVGVAIGDWVLDLVALQRGGLFDATSLAGDDVFEQSTLNAFIARGPRVWSETREWLTGLLSSDNPTLRDHASLRERGLIPRERVRMLLPVNVGDFTDFYASKDHASNVGRMFRDPTNPLTPNWVHMPIGYHGRSSSIVVSGTDIHRPWGQIKPDDAEAPLFGPSKALDFELEVGFFVGKANAPGQAVSASDAPDHLFGMVLVNDWSARDIQRWEYVPLGPFLGKSFATSISPWVVPMAALWPFRVPGPPQDPAPLPHLRTTGPWGLNIELEVLLQTARMAAPQRICAVNFKTMYWNILQLLVHHTSNGTPLRIGDLCASGTVSGPDETSRGSLLELAWKGTRPLALSSGETRKFLEDGDTVILRGWCQGNGYRVGFGDLSGRIIPSEPYRQG